MEGEERREEADRARGADGRSRQGDFYRRSAVDGGVNGWKVSV